MTGYNKYPPAPWTKDRPAAPYPPEPTHGQSIVDNDRRRRDAVRKFMSLVTEWVPTGAIVLVIVALGILFRVYS